MESIQIEHLSRTYQTKKGRSITALSAVNLEVPGGEFLTVVGSSGAGKSTLLRLIAGLEEASDGQVTLGGLKVQEIPPRDRSIGLLFQDAVLYPQLTVYENLAMPLKRLGLEPMSIQARLDRLTQESLLPDRWQVLPEQLSRGERQRVALARILFSEANLWLLDEPFASLDPENRFKWRREIVRVWEETGSTVVCVTHDPFEAMTLGSRVAVMAGGRLLQVDDPHTLYRDPSNTFVASFIGYPPMNLLSGRLVGSGHEWHLESVGGEEEPWRVSLVGELGRINVKTGGPVVLGIRPKDVRLVRSSVEAARSGEASVERVERFDGDAFWTLRLGSRRLLISERERECGEVPGRIDFYIPVERVSWFDSETLERVASDE